MSTDGLIDSDRCRQRPDEHIHQGIQHHLIRELKSQNLVACSCRELFSKLTLRKSAAPLLFRTFGLGTGAGGEDGATMRSWLEPSDNFDRCTGCWDHAPPLLEAEYDPEPAPYSSSSLKETKLSWARWMIKCRRRYRRSISPMMIQRGRKLTKSLVLSLVNQHPGV